MNESNIKQGSFWDILSVIIKWRRLLALSFMAAAFLTLAVASFLPKWYASTALLFPPQQESGGGLSSLLGGGLAGILSGGGSKMALPTFATPSDIDVAILKSRNIAERVIIRNNLLQVYNLKSMEIAVLEFSGHLTVAVEPNGMIRMAFEDQVPERAAVVAKTLVEELNRINSDASAAQATATRKFVEERLVQSKIDLTTAENDYRDFQQKNKAISLDDQMKAIITNMAELKGQLVLAEIELGVLKRTFMPSHPSVTQEEAKIYEIKKQLNLIEDGSPDSIREALSIPVSAAPNLGLELARLTRNLKIQETIFELLTQQYEQAKIQEKKDTPTIQVLDEPQAPEKKSRPKRTTLALMAGMLSLLMTSIIVFVKEFVDRNKEANTTTYHQLEKLADIIRADFYAFRSLFISGKGKEQ